MLLIYLLPNQTKLKVLLYTKFQLNQTQSVWISGRQSSRLAICKIKLKSVPHNYYLHAI